MLDNRYLAVWLHRVAGLLALLGALALSACGGGSGAPNNPFAPTPPATPALSVLPNTATVYSGVPTVVTIAGGVGPFRAFSSNGTVLPVTQTVNGNSLILQAGDVSADTPVLVTITDAAGQSAQVSVTVKPTTLLNTFTVVPNRTECGTTAICSGQTAVAGIVVQGPGGVPLPGRQVRFDVVSGPYSILTNNPGQPSASSVAVTSDASGQAQVVLQANVNAPTQPAQLRVTDLTTGQQRTANFLVVQNTAGNQIVTVVPSTTTITAAFKDECSSGARVDYYIFGGTPPYRITASIPEAVTIVNPTVTTANGFFEAITTGVCVDPLTFSILDATGRQTTATLTNKPGEADRPTTPVVPPSSLTIAPLDQTGTCANANVTFSIVVTGGTPPYNVSVAPPPGPPVTPGQPLKPGTAVVNQQPRSENSNVALITVNGQGAVGTANVFVRDSGSPQQLAQATLNCQ